MVADIDSPGSEFPLFPVSNRWEAELEPGDILFIPSLWFHNMKAHDFGVAVNVFWKELESKFYDPKEYDILVQCFILRVYQMFTKREIGICHF